MSSSPVNRYNILQKRIDTVLKVFDFKQPLSGITDTQADKLRGLRLLCHAEFEDYFETLAIELVENAFSEWQIHYRANYNLASLLIDAEKINKNENVETKMHFIISEYKARVQKNNGIKQEDLLKLFKPLGYNSNDFDQLFLSTLSSYGALRGETAHTSALRARQQLDKQSEVERIRYILSELITFEGVILSKAH